MGEKMKRILFYVHFNKNDKLADYVVYQLRKMRENFAKVVVISNSKLSKTDQKVIGGLCDELILRENKGFDFAAWRDGIKNIGWNEIEKYDSMVLMNDTCFGPIFDMKKVFADMDTRKDVDFWGMTNSKELGKQKEHIQSYFMSFSQKVTTSKAFRRFFENIKNFSNIKDVIDNYETKLTKILLDSGLSYSCLFDANKHTHGKYTVVGVSENLSELEPILMIQHKIPLIKIKSFKWVPAELIIKKIVKLSNYPADMITDHIKAINLPGADKAVYDVMSDYREFIDHQQEVIDDLRANYSVLSDQLNEYKTNYNQASKLIDRIHESPIRYCLGVKARKMRNIFRRANGE